MSDIENIAGQTVNKQNTDNRAVFVWFVLGTNGSGKSKTLQEIIRELRGKGWKKKIVRFDPQDRFKEFANETIPEGTEQRPKKGESLWKKYFKYIDTCFIIDDYRELMDDDSLDSDFLKLMSQRRENGNDFIFMTWHPKLIIERLSYFSTHYFIYNMGMEAKGALSTKVKASETVAQIFDVISKYHLTTGKTSEDLYPKFPFAYVDINGGKIDFVNMPQMDVDEAAKTITIYGQQ